MANLSPSLLALGAELLKHLYLDPGAKFKISLRDGTAGPRQLQQAVHAHIATLGLGIRSRLQNGALFCTITKPRKDHRLQALGRQHRNPKPTTLPALPYALLPNLAGLTDTIHVPLNPDHYSPAATVAILRQHAGTPRPKIRYYPSCKVIIISPARTTPVRAYPSYTNDAMQWPTFHINVTRVIENSPTVDIVKVRRTILTLAANRNIGITTRIIGNRLYITRTT